MKRSSGILMPISALCGGYGIGTIGKHACAFADFLKEAGQSYWQILPAGPTSYGDSPYQSFSSFAGNPYFIDPDILTEKGYLLPEEIPAAENSDRINYEHLYLTRFEMLRKASVRAYEVNYEVINAFKEREQWVDPYAKFMALKRANGMKALGEWEIRQFDASMKADYDLFVFIQFEFFSQWDAFRSYVNSLGIRLIGDIPIYVSADSADVWQDPHLFLLDEKNVPQAVSGVPPDYFSEDGQLWGNPLYNYSRMKEDGYGWWINRIGQASRMYDVIRIDHFRGFASYWSVPYGEKTAKNGKWITGPGMDLVGTLTSWFSGTEFIAEDLGILTPDVEQLLKDSGLPGMKVLQFAFDGKPDNPHLPHNYTKNSVCYTGTHDNSTLAGWIKEEKESAKNARAYLGIGKKDDLCEGLIRTGMASVSKLFVAPLQDYLELDDSARINIPGTSCGNWTWRLTQKLAEDLPAKKIRKMTERYGRLADENE